VGPLYGTCFTSVLVSRVWMWPLQVLENLWNPHLRVLSVPVLNPGTQYVLSSYRHGFIFSKLVLAGFTLHVHRQGCQSCALNHPYSLKLYFLASCPNKFTSLLTHIIYVNPRTVLSTQGEVQYKIFARSPYINTALAQNKCRYKDLLRYYRHGSCPSNIRTSLHSNIVK
jgi:hypothetical protein